MKPLHTLTMVIAPVLALAAAWSGLGRANAPPGRYTVQNGTVYDTKTKLTWQQVVTPGTYTWANAKSYCTGLQLNGTGWRLPNVKELQTIVDETNSNPAIDSSYFPNTPSSWFWTSSPLAGSSYDTWYVEFNNGDSNANSVANSYQVRCVR